MYKTWIKEFIFEDDRDFKSCHASTLVTLPDESILAAWFGGTEEGAKDVAIWCAKKVNGKWQAPIKVADEDGIPHWNPVLFADDKKVYLFYKVGHTIPKWETMVMESEDEGETWSKPRALVEGDIGGRGPVRNKPIMAADGAWLAPASIEDKYWDAFVDISYDKGGTWQQSQWVPIDHKKMKGKGIIQPTLWESEPDMIHMLLRSTEGFIYRSDSEDGGRTWSPAYPTDLPNNNSGIDLTCLDDGTLVLVFNPVGENWGKRTPLVVKVSKNNGETWTDEFILEDRGGEYSYPAIISQGNMVYITYTWKRERIVFWEIDMDAKRG